MENIRRRKKSPETRRLVERKTFYPDQARLEGMIRRKKTVFAPSCRNNRSWEVVTKFDEELIQGDNGLGAGCRQAIQEELDNPEDDQVVPEQAEPKKAV